MVRSYNTSVSLAIAMLAVTLVARNATAQSDAAVRADAAVDPDASTATIGRGDASVIPPFPLPAPTPSPVPPIVVSDGGLPVIPPGFTGTIIAPIQICGLGTCGGHSPETPTAAPTGVRVEPPATQADLSALRGRLARVVAAAARRAAAQRLVDVSQNEGLAGHTARLNALQSALAEGPCRGIGTVSQSADGHWHFAAPPVPTAAQLHAACVQAEQNLLDLAGDFVDVSIAVTGLTTSVEALGGRVDGVTGRVTGLEARMAAAEGGIGQLRASRVRPHIGVGALVIARSQVLTAAMIEGGVEFPYMELVGRAVIGGQTETGRVTTGGGARLSAIVPMAGVVDLLAGADALFAGNFEGQPTPGSGEAGGTTMVVVQGHIGARIHTEHFGARILASLGYGTASGRDGLAGGVALEVNLR